MENPIQMDDLGVPLFLETPIYLAILRVCDLFGILKTWPELKGWKSDLQPWGDQVGSRLESPGIDTVYFEITIHLPRTQVTLVLVEKGLVWGYWPSQIEVIWVLGTSYIILHLYCFDSSKIGNLMIPVLSSSELAFSWNDQGLYFSLLSNCSYDAPRNFTASWLWLLAHWQEPPTWNCSAIWPFKDSLGSSCVNWIQLKMSSHQVDMNTLLLVVSKVQVV